MLSRHFIRTFTPLLLTLGLALTACDDNTATLGTTLMPESDGISTSSESIPFTTRSVAVDSVYAGTSECYLGCVIDPETRAKTTCSFLAQYHITENLAFPPRSRMLTDEKGDLQVDSCILRVFFDDYFGDELTTMKLRVRELSQERIMEEGVPYYTNIDPAKYLPTGAARFDKTLTYSVKDLSRPATLTTGTTYYRSIIVRLPIEYGRMLIETYYQHPEYYSNSSQFIRHVCPGFYFEHAGGVGAMIHTKYMALDVYFPYNSTNGKVDGMQRMGATEEVIQNTHIDTSVPESLLDPALPYTYLKSPCGLMTEVDLPAAKILAGQHYTDSLNQVRIALRQYQNSGTQTAFSRPKAVLLVRKGGLKEFFEKGQLPNSRTSFLTTFNAEKGTYTFENIANLLNVLRDERDRKSGVLPTDTDAQREAKYAQWADTEEGADWNKLYLVPVFAEYSTQTSSLGITSNVLLRVRPAHGLTTLRLEGGATPTCHADVIYSRFTK